MKTQTVETIEMEITAVQNEMKGMDRMSAAYFNLEAKLEQLYYTIDDLDLDLEMDMGEEWEWVPNKVFYLTYIVLETGEVKSARVEAADEEAARYMILDEGQESGFTVQEFGKITMGGQ